MAHGDAARMAYAKGRVARNAAVVAGHPQWHGIRHPERLDFVLPRDEYRLRRDLAAAIQSAAADLALSERLAAQIAAVADGADRRLGPLARPTSLSRPLPISPPAARQAANPPSRLTVGVAH